MSFLPDRLDNDAQSGLTPRQLLRASRDEASAELEIYRYHLRARAMAEMDQIDSQAAADALRAGLGEEQSLLHDGLAAAGQSTASVELAARKVELLADTNNRRFVRRFGS